MFNSIIIKYLLNEVENEMTKQKAKATRTPKMESC